jgi:hypothetical protein
MRADDNSVFEDSFMSTARASDGSFNPTLILLGTKLGSANKVTRSYWEAIKAALRLPQSVGIAGYRLRSHCTARVSANLCTQWPTILLALLHRHPSRPPLLPRSTHHTSPPTCFSLRGRHRYLSHTSSASDITRRHGPLHALGLPHPGRSRVASLESHYASYSAYTHRKRVQGRDLALRRLSRHRELF